MNQSLILLIDRFYLFLRKNILAGVLLVSYAAVAQQPKEVIDTKAKGVLDEVAAKTKAFSSIKAEFVSVTEKQVTNKESKVTDTETGGLQIKGNKFRLEFKGQTIMCDGKTQWTYIKESNEVQINNAPDATQTDNPNPINIFTLYKKGYKYRYDNEVVVNGVKADVVDLFPLDANKKSFHTIRLTIDREKKQIISVKIMNKNGSNTTITLKNFTDNLEIPDAHFAFNKADYKGVEEVDLREK